MNKTAFLLTLVALLMVTSLLSCSPKPPTVTTGVANEVTIDAAMLGGSLDDIGGYSSVDVSFVWGPDSVSEPTAYPNETAPHSRTSISDFNATVSDLLPDTTYYFQARAIGDSSIVYGEESSFTTKAPPIVFTGDTTIISDSEVNLKGELINLGSASSVRVSFLWGITSGGPYPNETTSETMYTPADFTLTLGNLSAGTTYYYQAKVVGDSIEFGDERSLVTPVPVTFLDSNLETAIRNAIGKPRGVIYSLNLASLNELVANESDISDLTGLEHCRNIEKLHLNGNHISDISPLKSLTRLKELWLIMNQISDISPLASLTNLRFLQLHSNFISDASPVSSLINLDELHLDNNQLTDISPLITLTKLRVLDLNHNQISDISPLASLTNLRFLELDGNFISDASPVSSLINLDELQLDNNQLSDISPLVPLTKLTILDLSDNQISDISLLTSLTRLTELWLERNQISDISPLTSLTRLTELWLIGNRISDISPLVENSGLSSGDTLYLMNNPLNNTAVNVYIPQLQERGVKVEW